MSDLSNEEVDALSEAMGDDAPSTATAVESPPKAPAQPQAAPAAAGSSISKVQFMQLEELAAATDLPPAELEKMGDLKVEVEVQLGQTRMPLEQVLKLKAGSLVELDKLAGEPVDLLANGKLIARAEVVVIEESFGVKILEIAGTQQKLSALNK